MKMLGTYSHLPSIRFLLSLSVFDLQPFNSWFSSSRDQEVAKTTLSNLDIFW